MNVWYHLVQSSKNYVLDFTWSHTVLSSAFYLLPSSSSCKSDQAWEIAPLRKEGKVHPFWILFHIYMESNYVPINIIWCLKLLYIAKFSFIYLGSETFEHRQRRLQVMGNQQGGYEGIQTIQPEKLCQFSSCTGSSLCLCVITWNMNGNVTTRKLNYTILSWKIIEITLWFITSWTSN